MKLILLFFLTLFTSLSFAQNWETLLYDDFEAGWNWQTGDDNSADGLDYWGLIFGVGNNSSHSAYCAYYKNGVADGTKTYDNNMQAWMKKVFDCSAYSDLRITFSFYLDTPAADFIDFRVNDKRMWYRNGDSRGWQTETVYLTEFAGNSDVKIVFWFKSDEHTTGEGVYIDDVKLEYKQTPTTYPDLIVEDIWTEPASPQTGEDVEMYCRIKNIGDAPAEDITVRYYLDGLYVDKDQHRNLNPGESQEEHDPAPPFVTTGSHDYQVWIDHLDNESNTGNNKRQESITVGSQSAAPDLIVEDIWTVPATPKAGENTQLYCRIKNIGNADADNITIRYYINQLHQSKDSHDKLTPGATQEENEPFTFTYAANYEYEIRIDKVNGETNTENSKLNKTITVDPAGESNNPPVVSNTHFKQRDDGSFKVDVYYDLQDPDGDLIYITMQVSDNDGANFDFVCQKTTGDLGANITSAENKHIEWDFGAEHPQTFGDNFRIKIIADDNYSGGETGTVTDIDGNVYQTIKIGDQWWMAENLKVTRYSNGADIQHVTDNSEWTGLSTGAYCAYNNASYVAAYGLLYNWYAVDDSRNIAIDGWHVPSDEEFTELENYLIANGYNWDGSASGDKTGKSLASKTGWESSSEAGDVGNDMSTNNTSGFSALPGGCRHRNGAFCHIGNSGYWWSATALGSYYAWYRALHYYYSDFYRYDYRRRSGLSVRLIRD